MFGVFVSMAHGTSACTRPLKIALDRAMLTFQNCETPTLLRSMIVQLVSTRWPVSAEQTGRRSRWNFSYSTTSFWIWRSGVVTAYSALMSSLPSCSMYTGRPSW